MFGHPTLSMSTLKSWAADVSSRHISDGADPTTELEKVARENALTPHQIEVLAGEINKTIHISKYASAEDKYHAANFPLADAKRAIGSLQISGEKTAGCEESFADPVFADKIDIYAAFGVEESVKTASENPAPSLRDYQNGQLLQQKIADSHLMAKHAVDAAEMSFIKQARAYILSAFDVSERLTKLADVIHAADMANQLSEAIPPLAKVAYSLGAEGYLHPEKAKEVFDYLLEKKADVSAPQGLVSELLPAKVVNGTHPLLITLNTYAKCRKREEEEAHRHSFIDDKVRISGQKIRGL